MNPSKTSQIPELRHYILFFRHANRLNANSFIAIIAAILFNSILGNASNPMKKGLF